jgi:DNA-binding LacI/PurR family transcriptional regulator
MVTEHLVAQGRRRIAFLGAPEHSPEVMERYRGYEAALRTAGIAIDPALRIDAETTEQSGHDAVLSLLDRGVAFDAVFGASDLIAIGAMGALAARGLRVPGDVAVVGFDDIAMARSVTPSLTTVVQDTRRAGRLLVEALINLIEGKPVHSARLPTHLIVRHSSVAAGSTVA